MTADVEELREAGTRSTSSARLDALSAHVDARVRCLCARHPSLSSSGIARLARDGVRGVRVAIAHRRGLPAEVAAPLFVDPERAVRRAAFRHQPFDARLVFPLVRTREWSPQLVARLKESMATDIWLTAELFGDPRWRWFASCGAFDRRSVRASDDLPFVAQAIATNGNLTTWALLHLARSKWSSVQEAAGLRDSVVGRLAVLIALFGRSRAAAILALRSPGRLVRAVLAMRPEIRVRVARAQTTRSRWLLFRSAWSPSFPVAFAAAWNPAAGRWTRARLLRSARWAVVDAVVHRTDLSPEEYARAPMVGPVQMTLARNPAVQDEVVRWLLKVADRFARSMARIHPSLPLDERLAVLDDGDAPRWLLRHLAAAPDIPEDARERALVWLALGGGVGDPNFDPLTCTGTPLDQSYTRDRAFTIAGGGGSSQSSLWYTRALVGRVAGTISLSVLRTLATDVHPSVRMVAAGFNDPTTLRQLREDTDASVRHRADQTWWNLPKKRRAQLRVAGPARSSVGQTVFLMSWVIALFVGLAFSLAAIDAPTRAREGAPQTTVVVVQGIRPRWAFGDAPSSTPVCSSGGNRAWVERAQSTLSISVQTSDLPTSIVFVVVPTSGPAPEPTSVKLPKSRAATWTINVVGTGTVYATIGERPELPIVVPFGRSGAVTVGDENGDC